MSKSNDEALERGPVADIGGQPCLPQEHATTRGTTSGFTSIGVEVGFLFSRSLTIVTSGPSGLAGPEGGGGGLAAGAGLGAPEPPAAAGAGVPALPALPALQRPCLKAISGTLAAAWRTDVALIPPIGGGSCSGGYPAS